jgi:hypothetical protein
MEGSGRSKIFGIVYGTFLDGLSKATETCQINRCLERFLNSETFEQVTMVSNSANHLTATFVNVNSNTLVPCGCGQKT